MVSDALRPYRGHMKPLRHLLRRTREAVREHVVAPVEQAAVSRIICLVTVAALFLLFLAGRVRTPA